MNLFSFEKEPISKGSPWRELAIFSSYRLFLAFALCITFFLELPPDFLGASSPELYSEVSIFYLLAAIIFVITTIKKRGQFAAHTRLQLIFDIVFLTLLINASGGLSTGLGSLLVVVVVAGGALIPGRLSAFIAAIATLAVLLEVSYSQIAGDGVTKYSHAGMLGATFFVTALVAKSLSHKMKMTLQLADQRGQDVNKLALLNEHIISSMQTGIIVVDKRGQVTLINQSARSMVGIDELLHAFSLVYIIPALAEQLKKWKSHTLRELEPVKVKKELPDIVARFTALDSGETLIYIDNITRLEKQAQQLKLVSLGRLTASIAHEIRNPLGAISHAGELLAETYQGDRVAKKLTDIIQRHSVRVNSIIETILDMSRRKAVEPTVVILALWLDSFIAEFCEINHIDKQSIKLVVHNSLAKVRMDEEQLHQVMSNLLENAIYYSVESDDDKECISLTVFMNDNHVMIDVKDNGKGISEEVQQHLFEPFHSERRGGTGLGLYLARELCQANGAELVYVEQEKGCCFRVILPVEKQEAIY